jgi:predicted O-methyltransferase YrrM
MGILDYLASTMRSELSQKPQSIALAAKNLILGSNFMSLTLAGHPRQVLRYAESNLFHYKTLHSRRGVVQKNVFEVLPASQEETLNLGSLRAGATWFESSSIRAIDLISLCLICRIVRPKLIFEIGTFTGYTTYHMALNTPDDARIYTLDLPTGETAAPRLAMTDRDRSHVEFHERSSGRINYHFDGTAAAPKITCLFGDSAAYDFSAFHGKVDFFFIDGAHSFDYIRSDTLNAFRCCHQGSVIAWHDFARPEIRGVTRWIHELAKERDIFAVPGGSLAFMRVES